MDQQEYIEKLQEQINLIIGTKSTLKRRKKTDEDTQRDLFINTIPLLEHVANRGTMMFEDYGMDLSSYDEPYFKIIDSLLYLHFGKEAGDIIMFYVYERINPDGTINYLTDSSGNVVPLEKIEDLWELVKFVLNLNKDKK
jgi:hypothetical protein